MSISAIAVLAVTAVSAQDEKPNPGAPYVFTEVVDVPATPVKPAAAAYITEYYFEQTPNGDDYLKNDDLTALGYDVTEID